ncbi:Transposase IS200 like subfamily [Synechococcus sp. PCC 7335]|nr:Transposase IS200 like subfamily [Synechococcus sp. PCC 7335]
MHIVFVCKYRHQLLSHQRLGVVEQSITSTCAKWDCTVLEMNGELDHLHFVIDYPPKTALSKLIANLKTVSSRLYKKQFNHDYALWSGSYFVATCGGAPLEQIKHYVQNQNRPEA